MPHNPLLRQRNAFFCGLQHGGVDFYLLDYSVPSLTPVNCKEPNARIAKRKSV